jgi:hypothetical protein
MTATRPRVSEAEWLRTVGDALTLHGWWWYHARPARRASGKWVTPVQGSGSRGFPDVFAARGSRLLALELKAEGGRVSPAQLEWIERLRAAGIEAHIVRLPADLDFVFSLIRPDSRQMTLTGSTGTGASWLPQTERN